MDKWTNKVAVVTGASSGIGASIVKHFVNSGIITIGLARRLPRMEQIKSDLGENGARYMHCFECDVSNEINVKKIFAMIDEKFGTVNILVNNAGIMRHALLLSDDESNMDVQETIATNLLGVAYCSRAVYRRLKVTDDYGFIININSIFGHSVPLFPGVPPPYNIYAATKHGLTAMTEVMRQELIYLKLNKIRVTSISPGLVETEIMHNAAHQARSIDIMNMPHLQPDDVYESVRYVLSTPYNVNVKEIIIQPVGEQA